MGKTFFIKSKGTNWEQSFDSFQILDFIECINASGDARGDRFEFYVIELLNQHNKLEIGNFFDNSYIFE